jgi:prepilin peptidase CpaA
MSFTLPPREVEVALIAIVLAAAIYDVRYRRIPNWISVAGILAGLSLNSLRQHGAAGLMFACKGLALGFGTYFMLYAIHAMGAGDVKLMGAAGSLVGWQDWLGIFIATSLIGGIAAVAVMLLRARTARTLHNVGFILGEMSHGRAAYRNREELDVKSPKSLGLPHGVSIAMGTISYLVLIARWAR